MAIIKHAAPNLLTRARPIAGLKTAAKAPAGTRRTWKRSSDGPRGAFRRLPWESGVARLTNP